MQDFRNPWWLIVITIIPIAILFWIFLGAFQMIESSLSGNNISVWILFGCMLGVIWTSHFIYTIILIRRKKALDKAYGLATILVYSSFIYLCLRDHGILIPEKIAPWIISANLIFCFGSFLMPTVVHSLFITARYFTRTYSIQNARFNFIFAASMPVVWYFLNQILFPLWQGDSSDRQIMIAVSILLMLSCLFFMIRGIFILTFIKEEFFNKYRQLLKLIVVAAFPVAGLVANNDLLFNLISGDFSNPWFFILAIVNGLAISLPEKDHKKYRLLIFCVRSISFTYIIYFFLIFLPTLPLSAMAILVFGLGFILLSPVILMVFQTKILVRDFVYLYRNYSRRTINLIFIASIFIVPAIAGVVYLDEINFIQRSWSYAMIILKT